MTKESPHAVQLRKAEGLIHAVQADFSRVLTDPTMVFERESGFAMQLLAANEFTRKIALENAASLQTAIVNVAALGISLNPARKLAYLVPRRVDGRQSVCLDISYQGLIHVALESGAVVWAQSKLVYEGDEYENQGINLAPVHRYKPFGRNRSIQEGFLGVYVVVKLPNGDYLTHEMDAESVLKIMRRSESFKSGKSSPWKTDFGEMAKKTCAKQGSKLWPKNGRLATTVSYIDENGGGIDFTGANGYGDAPVNDLAMELLAEAHEIAEADDSKAMVEPWTALSAKLRQLVQEEKIGVDVFTTCKGIISARVDELKRRQEENTIDAEPGAVTESPDQSEQ